MTVPTAASGRAASGGPSVGSRGLSRKQRLIRPADFSEAYESGQKFAGRHMVLWLKIGEDAALRLGVVSSRRVGGAVQRNRARRRLRSLFRQERPGLARKADVILVARPGCVDAPWNELRADFLRLAEKAGLLRSAPASAAPAMESPAS